MLSLRVVVVASLTAIAVVVLQLPSLSHAFSFHRHLPTARRAGDLPSFMPVSCPKTKILKMLNSRCGGSADSDTAISATIPDFNEVEVAKTGGEGMVTASQQAVAQDLSLGAPRARPKGGKYLTKGGIQVTANVERLEYSKVGDESSLANKKSSEAVIESLVEKLDSHKGVLLTSSYEFPGRYARWSLGFVDPPLEVSGRADQCTIKALNDRGKVLLPAIGKAIEDMRRQNLLSEVNIVEDKTESSSHGSMVQIDVTIVPPPPVGTFSEEERSRQVRFVYFVFFCSKHGARLSERCNMSFYAFIIILKPSNSDHIQLRACHRSFFPVFYIYRVSKIKIM